MKIALLLFLLAAPVAAQGTSYNYCQANQNSFGQTASIQYAGSLDLAQSSFALTVTGVPPTPSSFGMFTYGAVQYQMPFGDGYLCIAPFGPGIHRMKPQPLGPGTIVHDPAQYPADFAAFTPGSAWNFQFWYRNPAAGGQLFNLSDALHVEFAP